MTATVVPFPEKSTTVRSVAMTISALRLALRTGSLVAPETTDRITARLFFKPRRPQTPIPPSIEGYPITRLEFETSLGRIVGWSWGEGPIVLFAHGWEGHAAQFVPMAEAAVHMGFRAVAFDMPAHGRSEGTHTSVVDMACAIREVAEDLSPFIGKDRAPLHAIVGHSLGGAATVLALHEGLRAERVVLLAPVAEPTPFAMKAAKFMGLSPERTAGMMRGMEEFVGRSIAELDVRRLAPAIKLPAIIFHDPTDREVPFAHGRGIASKWPGAEFVQLQGLGHRRLLKDRALVEQTAAFLGMPV